MNLSVTILHELIKEDKNIYKPVRILLGFYNEEKKTFEDLLSGRKYFELGSAYDLGLTEGIKSTFKLEDIFKLFLDNKFKYYVGLKINQKEFIKVLDDYWLTYGKDLKIFENDTLTYLPIDKYKKENNPMELIDAEDYNTYFDMLLNGDISVSSYLDKVYQDTNTQVDICDFENISIREVCDFVEKRVINQSSAIKQVVSSIYRSKLFKGENNKTCTLLVGPTGVGKTEIIESISKILKIPVTKINATRLTDNGYKGFNPDDIILNLYLNANKDIELAQKSILFIDEIDKKILRNKSGSTFNKTDILNSLLKMIEGDVYYYENKHYEFKFDTKDLIVFFAGAFSDLYESKFNEIGFNRIHEQNILEKNIDNDDLKEYGVPIEFLARIRNIVTLNKLSKDDLFTVLDKGELSLMKYYIDNFKRMGIELVIPKNIYYYVADKAYGLGTYARGLNVIVDKLFEEVLFEVFENGKDIERVELSEDIVLDNKKYKLYRR